MEQIRFSRSDDTPITVKVKDLIGDIRLLRYCKYIFTSSLKSQSTDNLPIRNTLSGGHRGAADAVFLSIP